MPTRGVRGATTVARNEPQAIVERTHELILTLIEANGIAPADLATAIFTVSADLDGEFPALAVRSLPGWDEVPLLCSREIPVPASLGHCVRVLLLWNTERSQGQIRHAFLRGARELRPLWAVRVPGDDAEAVVRLPTQGPAS